jgi:hypothetical protein
MTWLQFAEDDRREQEQLDICRALVEDATKDTVLWLEDNPSAEERVHVLAIQEGLATLARIIARRTERRKEVRDEWDWPEAVIEVLSRLGKASAVRGHIVGKGLGRLAERLPQGLPSPDSRNTVKNVESNSTNQVAANSTREAVLGPILSKKGFTVTGWATQAGVDFHTADDYLNGLTKPYPDTLKKLANALGIKAEEMPD